ncbi:protein PSK SIMULATOR 3-like isoform X2 [Gastrolobium bilobum]|uniref:protein PSK SIMULATOR 3-like isoform X2 n=1 Tax=Gastrolobium bilobum TaxID=150636 RepID=UPI002AB050A6|nr:protein PSK SIMULATOR 3-like isoform X2 [Gastrolobium bilobum]
MALETWLIKVKTALSNSFDSVRPSKPKNLLLKKPSLSSKPKHVGVLSFEIAGVMSKLLHLWQSLSDDSIIRLRNDAIAIEGVWKLISNDESFLLGLAVAEFADTLRLFADSGRDPHSWTLTSSKEIEAKHKRMERYVTHTATLHREMDELSVLESALRKALHNNSNNNNNDHNNDVCSLGGKEHQKVCDFQQKIFWQKQEVKDLKERSLWNKGFDAVLLLLVRSIFTVLARIKVVFGIGHCKPCLSRSLSASATVYPSDQNPTSSCIFVSGPLKSSKLEENKEDLGSGFFESNCKLLKPPPSTLGASALALHYANLIIVMEKMIKSPQLVGVDARDDLYAMLPSSIRSYLRSRLKGVGFSACDPVLAGEWRDALGRILGWLLPLAHNMIKWQSERSFEQQNLVPKTNVLLLQTLFFANKEKTEAAITELLVGLNYIWRFEREMTAKALFECTNFNGLLSLRKPS